MSMSRPVMPLAMQASIITVIMRSTAFLKTSLPSMRAHMSSGATLTNALGVLRDEGTLADVPDFSAASTSAKRPSAPSFQFRTPRSSSVALTMTAPAPSPKSEATPRPRVARSSACE